VRFLNETIFLCFLKTLNPSKVVRMRKNQMRNSAPLLAIATIFLAGFDLTTETRWTMATPFQLRHYCYNHDAKIERCFDLGIFIRKKN
jgi:hypothetical protein